MKYLVITLSVLSLPITVLAAPAYNSLVTIPGVTDAAAGDFNAYINALYAFSIGIAALLAVVKIIIAGVKWMMSDVVTSKEEAKKDIRTALIGLIIILAAVLILTVINPQFTNVDLSLNPAQNFTSKPSAATIMNQQTGDILVPFQWGFGQAELTKTEAKNLCENQIPAECTEFANGQLTGQPAACYKGEYYDINGIDKCLVRADKTAKPGEDIGCTAIYNQTTDLLPTSWDCAAATTRCTDANLKPVQTNKPNDTYVTCHWP